MRTTRPWRVAAALVVVAGANLILSASLATFYARAVVSVRNVAPSTTNAWFFALQTITSTGYGSEVNLDLESVQRLANFSMPLGSLLWGLSVAAVWNALTHLSGPRLD